MELKTTLFAVFIVIVINWRNKKIAELYGERYLPYGLSDIKSIIPESLSGKIKQIKSKKKNKAKAGDT